MFGSRNINKIKACSTVFINCKRSNKLHRLFSTVTVEIGEEVRYAILNKKPVVALESTIITHGMPFPDNMNCALEIQNIIREEGATPATVGILQGRVKVGLADEEIKKLAESKNALKVSRRDFAYAITNQRDGGTTVAGTLIAAEKVKIPILATGGIGGVHRGVELTFDVSADLMELGRTPIAIVSSGVKSILDIPKTLEYLETLGVFVSTFGDSLEFPAFYSKFSGVKSPYNLKNPVEAANLLKSHLNLDLKSGLLIAVPIPNEFSMNEKEIEIAIKTALTDAQQRRIKGKEITPFLLERISRITGGQSLKSNVALIKNNAKVAAQIAKEFNKLSKRKVIDEISHAVMENSMENSKGPIVIGGSIVDCTAKLKGVELLTDGQMQEAKFYVSAGGVGRNICEALEKLGANPKFLSVVGDDFNGDLILGSLGKKSRSFVSRLKNVPTSQSTVIIDNMGECKHLLIDVDIHKEITSQVILDAENVIKESSLIVFDGNLSLETTTTLLKLAGQHNKPVVFEPTDVPLATTPFQTSYRKNISIITPNLNELKEIAKYLKIKEELISGCEADNITSCSNLALAVANEIDTVILTLGKNGVIVSSKRSSREPLLNNSSNNTIIPHARHYLALPVNNLINVSGAGDCLTSGIIAGIVKGLSEEECVTNGLRAAADSLKSNSAIPFQFSNNF